MTRPGVTNRLLLEREQEASATLTRKQTLNKWALNLSETFTEFRGKVTF